MQMITISDVRCEHAGELMAAIKAAIADSHERPSAIYPYPRTGSEGWNVRLLEDRLTDGSKVYHISIRETV